VTIDASTPVTFPADDAWLNGLFAPVADELDVGDLEVEGSLPPGLRGAFLRNGPNPAFPPIVRYHVFDGDGMIHGITFDGEGGARYRNRFVESRALLAERRAGHALYGGLAQFVVPDPEVVAEGGLYKNTANTHVVRHAGRILALMEGAGPTELRADLSTVGEYDFGGRLVGAMTAHPKVDPATGEMLFFGYSPLPPFLRFHVTDAAGTLLRSVDLDLPRSVMMHDFAVTERHVVLFDLPALFDLQATLSGGAAVRWEPQHGARIGVLPRDATTDEVRWTEVEPFYVFHFLNAYDEGDSVVVEGCRASRLPLSFGEEPLAEPVQPALHRWRIDTTAGSITDEQLDDRAVDFPRVADAAAGLDNRYGYAAHLREGDGEFASFSSVVKYDRRTGDATEHVYGPHAQAGEAVFAADPHGSAEDDGWLLNFVVDKPTGHTDVVVLDARDVAAGPVAEVRLPRRVPIGFHGSWLPDS
jgi:carotenoid cleavage dioxygenase